MTKKTALPRHELAQGLPPGLNAVKKKWCGVGRSPNTTPRPYTRVQLKLKKKVNFNINIEYNGEREENT
jgi:hypothetical protein